MLLIAGSIRIDTSNRDELMKTAIEVVRELRKQIGCTFVALSEDLEDPGLLHLLQKWESQEALSLNIASPHVAGIASHAGKLGIRAMTISKYAVGEVGPLEEPAALE